jgi:hypothetical protein
MLRAVNPGQSNRPSANPNLKIINRQGARNAKTRVVYSGKQAVFLTAPKTGSRVLESEDPNMPSLATLASWRLEVLRGLGLRRQSPLPVASLDVARSYRDAWVLLDRTSRATESCVQIRIVCASRPPSHKGGAEPESRLQVTSRPGYTSTLYV